MRAATVVAHWTTVASLSARPPSLANQQLDSATGLKVLANARGTPEVRQSLGKKGVSRRTNSKNPGRRPKKTCPLVSWRRKSKAQRERAGSSNAERTAREKPDGGAEAAAARAAAEPSSAQSKNEDPNLSSSSSSFQCRGKRGKSLRELIALRGEDARHEEDDRPRAMRASLAQRAENLSFASSSERHRTVAANRGAQLIETATRPAPDDGKTYTLASKGGKLSGSEAAFKTTRSKTDEEIIVGRGNTDVKGQDAVEDNDSTADEIDFGGGDNGGFVLDDQEEERGFQTSSSGKRCRLSPKDAVKTPSAPAGKGCAREGDGAAAALDGRNIDLKAAELSSAQEDSNSRSSLSKCHGKLGKSTEEQSRSEATRIKPHHSHLHLVNGTLSASASLAPGLDTQLDTSDTSEGVGSGEAVAALGEQSVDFMVAELSPAQNEDPNSCWPLSSSLSQRRGKPEISTREESSSAAATRSTSPHASPQHPADERASSLAPIGLVPRLNTQLDASGNGGEGEQPSADESIAERPVDDGRERVSERARLDSNNRQPSTDEGDAEASAAGDLDENDVGPRTDAEMISRQDVEAEVNTAAARFDLSAERREKLIDIAYRVIQQITGDIGGNGQGAAMYGEMIKSSCQKAIDFLVKKTGLGPDSRFIDIGCGRAKPPLHAALYARANFSFGIELDPCRVFLANVILKMLVKKARSNPDLNTITNISVQHGDISEALCLDPFTHVWMFDVAPGLITNVYRFDVKLLGQLPTSMHSSGEGHMLYFYERLNKIVGRGGTEEVDGVKCDPLFAKRYGQVSSGHTEVVEQLDEDIQIFRAFNPVKERDERKSPNTYEPEDFRDKEKKPLGKRRGSKKSKKPKKVPPKQSKPDSNLSKRKKGSLKKRKRADQLPSSLHMDIWDRMDFGFCWDRPYWGLPGPDMPVGTTFVAFCP
ncbi:hypothetical protein THAOC_25904 [Thalassiosira oceanica]|uniref:DOT1 domain-containing protein n=1 Tax=Thalassiosira oceanica TaxID=159749 RepID=K0RMU1_THAOC|nr:hypothetical protein THAOC_25904 [Thalassiosira oceanica]|eukprot:EJK54465.1 hypothetical protein THAOC_25904 [Thalassiosira oceanica]